jgi:hypothetical protein
MEKWLEDLKVFKASYASSELRNSFKLLQDFNYLHALSKFQLGNTAASINFLDLTAPIVSIEQCDPFPIMRMQQSDHLVLQSLIHPAESANSSHLAKVVLEEPMRANQLNSIREMLPFFIRLRCIWQMQHSSTVTETRITYNLDARMFDKHEQEFNFHYNDVGYWNKINRVKNFLSQEDNEVLTQRIANIAIKHENYELARRYVTL